MSLFFTEIDPNIYHEIWKKYFGNYITTFIQIILANGKYFVKEGGKIVDWEEAIETRSESWATIVLYDIEGPQRHWKSAIQLPLEPFNNFLEELQSYYPEVENVWFYDRDVSNIKDKLNLS